MTGIIAGCFKQLIQGPFRARFYFFARCWTFVGHGGLEYVSEVVKNRIL